MKIIKPNLSLKYFFLFYVRLCEQKAWLRNGLSVLRIQMMAKFLLKILWPSLFYSQNKSRIFLIPITFNNPLKAIFEISMSKSLNYFLEWILNLVALYKFKIFQCSYFKILINLFMLNNKP